MFVKESLMFPYKDRKGEMIDGVIFIKHDIMYVSPELYGKIKEYDGKGLLELLKGRNLLFVSKDLVYPEPSFPMQDSDLSGEGFQSNGFEFNWRYFYK